MKNIFWLSALVIIFLFFGSDGGQKMSSVPMPSQPPADKVSQILGPLTSPKADVDLDFGRMPLYFIRNEGQMDERVAYYIQGKDKNLYFTSEGLTFVLTKMEPLEKDGKTPDPRKNLAENQAREQCVVKLDFVGANPDVHPVGEEKTGAVISYFKGKPEEWQTGVSTYSRIVYANLWPGIDLAYFGTANKLKYEFIIHPGADPSSIDLAYRGATLVKVNKAKELEVETPLGGFKDDRPVAYQEGGGKKADVDICYELKAGENATYHYGFRVGEYDRNRVLILDPAVVVYCGFIGGIGGEQGRGIAVDSAGNAYIIGDTLSTQISFPVTVGPDTIYNGGSDAFVAKVSASGAGLVYCGYVGGTGDEYGWGIAVDGSGNAYITGLTSSTEASFPVIAGPDYYYNGGTCDAFVAKVNASGTVLFYCGYIGGTDSEVGYDIDVDSMNYAYVVGSTSSSKAQNFPGTITGNDLSGADDAFVAKVKSDGSGLTYCRYIGGASEDFGYGISIGIVESAYITGLTYSDQTSFPKTTGPNYQGGGDAFVANLGPTGALAYCRYIGGTNLDVGKDIQVDNLDYAYIAGYTASSEANNFPVTVGPDLTYNGGTNDAFVAKVKYGGTDLLYCGYIGGSGEDRALGMGGYSNVTGYTSSTETSFPVSSGPDMTYNGGTYDAFVARVRSDGTGLYFCGYIGGSGTDQGNAIAGGIVTGVTSSTEASFPVSVGPDPTYNGGSSDVFVAKITYWMKNDFNQDWNEDILWRYYGSGGYNCVWFLDTSGGDGLGLQTLDSKVIYLLRNPSPDEFYWDARQAVEPLNRTADKIFSDAREAGNFLNRTMDKLYQDAREAGGFRSRKGALPVQEGSFRNLEQRMGIQNFTSPMEDMISLLGLPVLGGANLPAIADLGWHIDGTGDFNGDGYVDILWRYYGPGGYNCVWFMNGTTVTGGANLPAVSDLNWQIGGTGDFNRDGKVDILWRYIGSGGYNCVWFLNGTTVSGGANLPAVADSSWTIGGTGDFNGDGNVDILWRYIGSGGYNCVWFTNGWTITGGANLPAVSDLSWTIGGTGDFNGDGKVDILWRYYGSGGFNCVWFMNGTTPTGGADLPAVPDLNWRIVNR